MERGPCGEEGAWAATRLWKRHGSLDKQGSLGDGPHSSQRPPEPLPSSVDLTEVGGPGGSAPQEKGVHRPLPALQPHCSQRLSRLPHHCGSINPVLGGKVPKGLPH